MKETTLQGNHNFILENRHKTVLTGVREIESFDNSEVHVFTELGELKIRGKDLQIILADTENGDMEISGRIDAIMYGNSKEKVPNNFIAKLFK